MSYWREKAISVIADAIASTKVNLENLSEQDKQQLKCAIDAAYPFGSRKNHPYQVWLDERRKAFIKLGLVNEKIRSKGEMPLFVDSVVPGQQSLFFYEQQT